MDEMKSLLLIGEGAGEAGVTDFEAFMVTQSKTLIGQLGDELDLAACDLQLDALIIAASISPQLAEAVLASAVPFGYVAPRSVLEAIRADNPMLHPWAATLLSVANVVLVPAAKDAIYLKESAGVSSSCRILVQDEFKNADLDRVTRDCSISAMVECLLQVPSSAERMKGITGRELYSIMLAVNTTDSHEVISVDLDFPVFRGRPWEPFGADCATHVSASTQQFLQWRGHVIRSLPLTKNGKSLWGEFVAQAELARQFCIEWNLAAWETASRSLELAKNLQLKEKLERAGISTKLLSRLAQAETRGAEPFEGSSDDRDCPSLSPRIGELLRINEERLS